MPEENAGAVYGNLMVDFGLCAGIRGGDNHIFRDKHTYRDGKKHLDGSHGLCLMCKALYDWLDGKTRIEEIGFE